MIIIYHHLNKMKDSDVGNEHSIVFDDDLILSHIDLDALLKTKVPINNRKELDRDNLKINANKAKD